MRKVVMRASRAVLTMLLVLGFGASAPPVLALDIVASETAFYPEGVTRVGRSFWYAEMSADRVTRWQGERQTAFATPGGCGPTSVEPYGNGFVVLCHMSHRLLVVDRGGRVLETRSRSDDGFPLERPNDARRDDRGGVYFSSSGRFSPIAPATGRVFYLAADGALRAAAEGIHYANGVEFDARASRLLVSAHIGRQVLEFPVESQGVLGRARILHDLRPMLESEQDWMVGPDGLHLDADGTLRVALYAGGRVLVFSGARITSIKTPMRYPTTVMNDARAGLFVGGTIDLADRKLRGQVILVRPGPDVLGPAASNPKLPAGGRKQ